MKKIILAILLAGVAVLLPQVVITQRPLADLIPAGPLLYLEAKDFGALIRDWNGSNTKGAWLASANYAVFSRSRLFLRLNDAQREFGTAAGFDPDMLLVNSAAGSDSALALYDIGNLEFLYITRMPSARAFETALWQSRAKFQPRKSAGIDYYVRQQQRRLAAFAVTGGLLLIATQEQALASALTLIAGQTAPVMKQEPWFSQAAVSQPNAGELRMALNLERIKRTPYFRSYWIQRNTGELAQFGSAMVDLDRTAGEFRERRTLLRTEPAPDLRSSEASVSELSRYAPDGAGLIRGWAKPDTGFAMDLIDGLLNPRAARDAGTHAPQAGDPDAIVGTEQDLETRIDESVVAGTGAAPDMQPVRKLLDGNPPEAMLEVGASRVAAGGVFVATDRAIAILGARAWDPAAAGANVTVAGRVLIIANSDELRTRMAARAGSPAILQGAAYAALYRHARELPNLQRMMSLIDFPSLHAMPEGARQPMFFSENLASLGRALSNVESMSLESHDDGAALRQAIVYKLQ